MDLEIVPTWGPTAEDVLDWCVKHEAITVTKNSITSDMRDARCLSLQQLTEKWKHTAPGSARKTDPHFSGNILRTDVLPLYGNRASAYLTNQKPKTEQDCWDLETIMRQQTQPRGDRSKHWSLCWPHQCPPPHWPHPESLHRYSSPKMSPSGDS